MPAHWSTTPARTSAAPTGTGVIQGNNLLSGDIIANSNDGQVWLLDPTARTAVVIAQRRLRRGDYVGVDNGNGSLFLTQTDSCSIG